MPRPRLNKRFTLADGFEQSPDPNGPAVDLDSGYFNVRNSGLNTPGIVASGNGVITTPSGHIVGNQNNQVMLNAWRIIYTWNIPAILPGTGSINNVVSADAAMSGATRGDFVSASIVGSCDPGLSIVAVCYSNNNINLRAQFTGTTGAFTPGNVPLKIIDIQL